MRANPNALAAGSCGRVRAVDLASTDADLVALSGQDFPAWAIRVGTPGNVTIVDADGAEVTFTGCVAGELLRVIAARVVKATTTAGSLTAFF